MSTDFLIYVEKRKNDTVSSLMPKKKNFVEYANQRKIIKDAPQTIENIVKSYSSKTSADVNKDGTVDLRDVVRAKKNNANSEHILAIDSIISANKAIPTFDTKALEDLKTGIKNSDAENIKSLKNYLLSDSYKYSQAVKKYSEKSFETEDEKNKFVELMTEASKNKALPEQERKQYENILLSSNDFKALETLNQERIKSKVNYEQTKGKSKDEAKKIYEQKNAEYYLAKYGTPDNIKKRITEIEKRQKEKIGGPESLALDKEKANLEAVLKGGFGSENRLYKSIIKEGAVKIFTAPARTFNVIFGIPAKALVNAFGGDSQKFADNFLYESHLNEMVKNAEQERAESAYYFGKGGEIFSELGVNIITNIPNVALAFASGGLSLTGNLSQAASTTKTLGFVKNVAKNPLFWTSFVMTTGDAYQEAKENGISDAVAYPYAIATSLVNSYIEIGGGIETLPGELSKVSTNKEKLLEWVTSSIEEGAEEIFQGTVSELGMKLAKVTDNRSFEPLKSNYGEIKNFALNSLKEAGMGVLAGMVMGAGQMTFSEIINAKANSQYATIGRDVKFLGVTQDIIDYSLKSPDGNIRGIAGSFNANNIPNNSLGRLYNYVCNDVNIAINYAPDVESVNEGLKIIVNQTDNAPAIVSGIAVPQYVEKMTSLGVDKETIAKNIVDYTVKGKTENTNETNIDTESENGTEAVNENGNGAESDNTISKSESANTGFTNPPTSEIADFPTAQSVADNLIGKRKNANQKHIERITTKLKGVSGIVWDEKVSRAYFDPADKSIHFNPNRTIAENYTELFSHEFGHSLEERKDFGEYKSYLFDSAEVFEEWVREKLKPIGNFDSFSREEVITAYAQYIQDQYLNSKELSKSAKESYKDIEKVKNELVTQFNAEVVFGNNDTQRLAFLEELARGKKNLFERIIEFIENLIARFKGDAHNKTLVEDLGKFHDEIVKLQQKVKEVYNSEEIKGKNNGVSYSLNKSFSEQIDDVLSGKHNPRLDLYISDTPKYLVDLNFPQGALLMRNGKVNEILKDHPEMDADIIKMIPTALKDPLLILKSKTHPKESVVVITDIKTAKGEMIIPIWVNQEGNFVDVDLSEKNIKTNFVASSYGRSVKGLIEYAVNNDGVLYQNPKIEKVRNLLARNGLQLSTPLKISNSNISIPTSSENVKNNIKETLTGYASGETYFTMTYEENSKTVGTLEYGEYDGKPNVKMIEISKEYRRKGIATKLLQELQRKYPDQEIDFGMTTEDGTKLLNAITYDVIDKNVVADRKKLKNLQNELNDLQEKLDYLYDIENPTDKQTREMIRLGDKWQEVYESVRELEDELKGKKATKTYVNTQSVGNEKLSENEKDFDIGAFGTSQADTEKLTKKLLRQNRSSADVDTVNQEISTAVEFAKDGEWGSSMTACLRAAKEIVSYSKNMYEISDDAAEMLKKIREQKIRLDDAQKVEVANIYGSYNNFRKKHFNKLYLLNDAPVTLDSQWQEWAEEYPGIFDPDTNSADMPMALVNIIEGLNSQIAGYDVDGAQETLATQIFNEITSGNKNDKVNKAFVKMEEKQIAKEEKIEKKTKAKEKVYMVSDKIGEQYNKMLDKYGAIERGENAVENAPSVPKTVDGKKPTRRFSRTTIEAKGITEEAAEALGVKILADNLSYNYISNKKLIEEAKQEFQNGTALIKWNEGYYGKKIGPEYVAAGEVLLKHAIDVNDRAQIVDLTCQLSEYLTIAGQTVQAARILKQLTGAGRVIKWQRQINKLNQELEKRYGKKSETQSTPENSGKATPHITLDETLAGMLAKAETEEEMEEIEEIIVKDIASQLPSTWLDKWNAWRYMAMLLNPTTHIRNITGNTFFYATAFSKDKVAAVLEDVVKAGTENSEHSFKLKKEYKDFAKQIVKGKEVQKAFRVGKFNTETAISQERRIFNTGWLEWLRKFGMDSLEKEDLIFKNLNFVNSLAGYLQAKNIDISSQENIDFFYKEEFDKAIDYAFNQALKNTFNNANAVTNWISKGLSINSEDTNKKVRAKVALNFAVDSVSPFRKTTVNIVARGIEYSPLGLVKSLTLSAYDFKKGEITEGEFLDSIAAGLNGTAIFGLGALAFLAGLVKASFGKDDDDELKRLDGEQPYSAQILGKSYTIDWSAPASVPFFMGAEFCKAINDDFAFGDLTNLIWQSLDPIANLTMLDGLQRTLQSISYASMSDDKGGYFSSAIETAIASYFTQGLPTLGGKISRIIDPTERANYVSSQSFFGRSTQQFANSVRSKIPGLSYTKPARINEWGEKDVNSNLFGRIAENLVSPGYYSDVKNDEVTRKLIELQERSGEKVAPAQAEKSFEVSPGKRKYLNEKEYEQYAISLGKLRYKYVKEFINSYSYNKLDDSEKAEVIGNLYSYAKAKAKSEVSDYDIKNNNQFKKAYAWEKSGKSVVPFYVAKTIK